MLKLKVEYVVDDNKLEEMLKWYNKEHKEKLSLDEFATLMQKHPEDFMEYCEGYILPQIVDIKGYGRHDKRWWE